MRHRSRLAGTTRIRAELAAARRDTTGARAAYLEAIELGEGVDALEWATTHAAFGRFLRRRGERRSAINRLTTAHRLAAALGAMPLIRICIDELAVAGNPVVAPAQESQWASELTPQERAVARLVCAGKSNKQIARELVLSGKTIGFHLGNVYAKLGVHSRSELIIAMPLG
jgi:DNA-binding CsgD family transcriptional regulator